MEGVRQFWNERPCNIRHSQKEVGTLAYFDEVEAKKYKAEPHIPAFADFKRWAGKRVLEIGSGIGTDATNFCRHGADYTGIDLTEKAVEIVRKRLEVFDLSGSVAVCNAEQGLPKHESGTYDLVYSFGVIHHTPNPKVVIDNIAEVTEVGAELRIMLYSKWSYKLFWMLHEYKDAVWDFGEGMDNMVAKYAEAQTGCPIAFTYTFDEVKQLLSPHFEVEQIWKDHIFPFKIEPYKRGVYEVVDEFASMSPERFQSMCHELGWHTLVVAKRV
jgi:SAM-dependent methyltransferase